MIKKIILSMFLFCVFVPVFAQYSTEPIFYTHPGVDEISLFGGIAASNKERDLDNKSLDYGGNGFAYGITALKYINRYFAAGFGFSYSDKGYGSIQQINGAEYRASIRQYTPSILGKIHLFPSSPLSLYIPLGVGADIVKFGLAQEGKQLAEDTQTGLAFMVGLGAELQAGNGTFFAIEGQVNYTDFMGTKTNGVSSLKGYSIIFKTGMKFDASFLM